MLMQNPDAKTAKATKNIFYIDDKENIMGSWFSNIQIRQGEAMDSMNADHIADLFTKKRSLEKTDKDNADIEISVFKPENSSWITVFSDLIDGDVDALLDYAKELSRELKTETLAISCFDSDYLFMNLIDAQSGVDAWASCGIYPDGKAPRRSNYAAWKSYVGDAETFRNAMRTKYTFAEECLLAVEPLLSLPVTQSMSGNSDYSEASHFYFKFTQRGESVRPPAFGCTVRPVYFEFGEPPNVVTFENHGDASRGVAVCLAGPCIDNRQVDVTSVCLQLLDNRGEWVFIPIDLEMREFSDGIQRLYGECRDIRIPAAVSQELPWKKRSDLEYRRSIRIRFSLAYKGAFRETDVKLGDLHVILIPLQNFSGQYGLVLEHHPTNEYPEQHAGPNML